MRVLVSAGEPSGDAHAAEVVAVLRAAGADVEAVGGPRMAAAGARLVADITGLGAMGLAEAAATVPAHLRLLWRLAKRLHRGCYDLALLVDYPGFHLRLAGTAANAGVPVLYYIAPQLWAWGQWRVDALRARVRRLAVILPFEERFFVQHGIPATFVGHPLIDRPPAPERLRARSLVGVAPSAPLLALFPGSRPAEIRRLWPVFRDAARDLERAVGKLAVAVATTPGGRYPGAAEIVRWRGEPAVLQAAADAGLCKSGTTTLEAALAGLPMAIAYRMHPLTFALARRAVRVPHVGLVNLLAGRPVVPELLQRAATPEALGRTLLPLLDPESSEVRDQRHAFTAIREALGPPGAAQRVAQLALELAA